MASREAVVPGLPPALARPPVCAPACGAWIVAVTTNESFPGRWIEGAGLVLGPLLVMSGVLRIATTHPRLAQWGLALTLAGLFARTFHAGIVHLAFQLVHVQGLSAARQAITAQYGSFHIFQTINLATMAGWIVLAAGAWRAGVLGPAQSAGLALMAAMPLGVLKGTGVTSIVAAAGLCVALVPLGVKVLSQGPAPRWWTYPLAAAVTTTSVLISLLG